MSRVFITGSADGLGQMAARQLVRSGHDVMLHARSEARAAEAFQGVPGALDGAVGDLASLSQTRDVAQQQVHSAGRFDAVIHNAAVGDTERAGSRPRTASRTSSRSTCSRRTC
jgi:NAD(P)-dependent dehydrogenase (short-subunit alcohol dehydrogenase family)